MLEKLADTCNKITPNTLLNLTIINPVEIKNEFIREKISGTRYNRCKIYNTINLRNLNKVYKNIKAKGISKINIDDIKKKITELDCYNFLTFINQFTEKDFRIVTEYSRSVVLKSANIILHNDNININDLDKIAEE